MFPRLFDGAQKIVKGSRTVIARRSWQDAPRADMGPDFRFRVCVVFRILQSRCHIKNLPNGGIGEGGALKFGHIRRDSSGLIELALGDQ